MVRVAINGFGRMGRLFLRAAWDRPDMEWVHINEQAGTAECGAHLLAFDSIHGRWKDDAIFSDNGSVRIDDHVMSWGNSATIEDGQWDGIDIVVECTGAFRTMDQLEKYFAAGVKKVVVAAPVKDDRAVNIVYGVNHDTYDAERFDVVTAASCTTNCLAPIVKVVHEQFGIERGMITTIHDATNTQRIVDAQHKDLRRARAVSQSLIPTTTGSATAISLIYPELKGRLNGHAVRVGLLNASLTDAVFDLQKSTSAEEVNAAFQAAANNADSPLQGILGYEERPLVSCDYTNDTRSCIIDGLSTMVTDERMLKVYGWYDNEIGYVNRMADVVSMVAANI